MAWVTSAVARAATPMMTMATARSEICISFFQEVWKGGNVFEMHYKKGNEIETGVLGSPIQGELNSSRSREVATTATFCVVQAIKLRYWVGEPVP
jgi:hypothetical protein